MSWAGLIIVAIACLGLGCALTVLWFRRNDRVVRGEIRARMDAAKADALQTERSRSDAEALVILEKNFGEGEKK